MNNKGQHYKDFDIIIDFEIGKFLDMESSLRSEIMKTLTTKIGSNGRINRNQQQETIDMSLSPRKQNAIRYVRRLSTIDETEIYHTNAETSSYEIMSKLKQYWSK